VFARFSRLGWKFPDRRRKTSMSDYTALKNVNGFESLIGYLRNELDWEFQANDLDDLTFDYDAETELGLDEATAANIVSIKQIRPLTNEQPWGIFYIDFEKKTLPVVALRRILSKLVVKRRASGNKSDRVAWEMHDLLFISSCGENLDRTMTFAHFSDNTQFGDLPILRVLFWNANDTIAHIQHAHETLNAKLSFPENPNDIEEWRKRWSSAFTQKHGEVVRTSKQLASRLAELAASIRTRANEVLHLENENGVLRKLHTAFQEALIHDLSYDDFADMYAQTISYGLLTAKISRPAGLVADNIADMIPVTNPFLKELLQTFLVVGGRGNLIDFDELGINDVVEMLRAADMEAVLRDFGDRNPNEDPAIHFYELFLKEYDREKRMKRGVFYTPRPVVSFIVRSVDEILRNEFDLADGLADTTTWGEMRSRNKDLAIPEGVSETAPFVQILDPATGTGTFLVEVIDLIFKTMCEKWKLDGKTDNAIRELWNEYVPEHLLSRLYGFELMMAPYSIAHMKIGLKLRETDYSFLSSERAQIYLTNTLEEPRDFSDYFKTMAPALAHEAEAANHVKSQIPITVVIGNPPYSGVSSNMEAYAQQMVDAYKFVDGKALAERKLWLQDDYVKFIRDGQNRISKSNIGVMGYITNHSYFDNPTFRGMRQSLMSTFNDLSILDLHGNTTRTEYPPDGITDKNVFDIQQGVGICLAARGGIQNGVRRYDLWGVREAKYSWLNEHRTRRGGFEELSPDSPYYFFKQQNTDFRAEYDLGWKISEAMPINSAGFITARDHFVVDIDEARLLERVANFGDLNRSDAEIRREYFEGAGSDKYPDGDTRGWKLPSARRRVAGDGNWKSRVRKCSYRPFDQRNIYWADWMVDWPRPEVSGHMLAGKNVAMHICRQSISESWAHVLAGSGLIDDCYVSNKSRERGYAHPLFLYNVSGGLGFETKEVANFSPLFLEDLANTLSLEVSASTGFPVGLSPENVFNYAYAVFYSPSYRNRYSDFLRADFPRLPLTTDLELFRELSNMGSELVALHLLEGVDTPRDWNLKTEEPTLLNIEAVGAGYPKYEDDQVFINKTAWFDGVAEEVWNFHIGGYQVCHKWLKDRKGRALSAEDIAHYGKITVALSETIRLMAEIDETIEAHGGFPLVGSQNGAI